MTGFLIRDFKLLIPKNSEITLGVLRGSEWLPRIQSRCPLRQARCKSHERNRGSKSFAVLDKTGECDYQSIPDAKGESPVTRQLPHTQIRKAKRLDDEAKGQIQSTSRFPATSGAKP